ncbi:MAG TPA: hypothetical protein VFZ96_10480 [Actinomycetota bacterium]|nr:hypothetical protein [Actinomycetota bacterium]
MSEHLTVVDVSDIRPGRLDELRASVGELARFVEANEPRPVSYEVFLDPDGTRMTVLQVHPDSASMELHMRVAADAFRPFAELLTLRAMDVYGEPSDELLGQLRRKVEMLGDATITVHRRQAGFARLGRPGG